MFSHDVSHIVYIGLASQGFGYDNRANIVFVTIFLEITKNGILINRISNFLQVEEKNKPSIIRYKISTWSIHQNQSSQNSFTL